MSRQQRVQTSKQQKTVDLDFCDRRNYSSSALVLSIGIAAQTDLCPSYLSAAYCQMNQVDLRYWDQVHVSDRKSFGFLPFCVPPQGPLFNLPALHVV